MITQLPFRAAVFALVFTLVAVAFVGCLDSHSPTQPMLEAGLIAGSCFRDQNGNGIRDAGESGVRGVRIVVYTCPRNAACSGILAAQTVTASDGSFSITGVPVGEYNVFEELSDSYVQTTPAAPPFHVALDSTHPWATGLVFGSRSSQPD